MNRETLRLLFMFLLLSMWIIQITIIMQEMILPPVCFALFSFIFPSVSCTLLHVTFNIAFPLCFLYSSVHRESLSQEKTDLKNPAIHKFCYSQQLETIIVFINTFDLITSMHFRVPFYHFHMCVFNHTSL